MERRSMSHIMCGSIHTHPQTFPTRLFFVCMRIRYVLSIGSIRQSYGPSISCFERLRVLQIRTYQKMVRQRRNYRRNISAWQCFDAEYHMQAFNHSISASRRFKWLNLYLFKWYLIILQSIYNLCASGNMFHTLESPSQHCSSAKSLYTPIAYPPFDLSRVIRTLKSTCLAHNAITLPFATKEFM